MVMATLCTGIVASKKVTRDRILRADRGFKSGSEMSVSIEHRELVEWAGKYKGPKFHAVLCDPPYGLEFMGKKWDAPHKATSFPKAGNLGGFANGNKPSFVRQGNIGARY